MAAGAARETYTHLDYTTMMSKEGTPFIVLEIDLLALNSKIFGFPETLKGSNHSPPHSHFGT